MAPDATSTQGVKSNATRITILLAILLAVGLVFLLQWAGADGQLDTPESATAYVCPADATVMDVTPARFEKMRKAGDAGPREGPDPRSSGGAGSPESPVRRGEGFYLRCPKCDKRIMVMGTRCLKDGTVFPAVGQDGKPAGCPKCGWKRGE